MELVDQRVEELALAFLGEADQLHDGHPPGIGDLQQRVLRIAVMCEGPGRLAAAAEAACEAKHQGKRKRASPRIGLV